LWRPVRKAMRKVFGLKRHKPEKSLSSEERESLHPCVAHRGFSGQAPENTMAAFELALSKPYVNWMELDVHLSSDDVPVVIHDSTLKRTTNEQGNVREYTAEQLGKLDAGSWFHPSFSKEGVPTLEQVLKLAAGRCKLNVELKGDDRADEETKRRLAHRAVDVIKAGGMAQDTVITSFRPELLAAVREYDPSLKLGLIIDESTADLVASVTRLGATTLSIGYTNMTTELLRRTAEAGIEVMAWTVNSRSDLAKLSRRNEPFQICTNYPDRWYAATREGDND